MTTEFYSVNDSDLNQPEAIQPVGNEPALPAALNRAPENLRQRTEILRAEANRERMRAARFLQLRPHTAPPSDLRARWYGPWDGTGVPTTEGTLVLTVGELRYAPILGAGEDRDPLNALKYSTTGSPHADLLAYCDVRNGADPEYVRIVADNKEEQGTDFLTITILRSSLDLPGGVPTVQVLGVDPTADDLGYRRGQVEIVVTISLGVSTFTTYQKLVDALNDPASPTFGLVTAYVMNGAGANCPTKTRTRFTPGLNATLLILSGGQLAAFFTASTENRLREGDTLALSLARWSELLGKTPDNATTNIVAGDLVNLTRQPGKKDLCVPLARVLGGRLHMLGGSVLPEYYPAYPPAIDAAPFLHASSLEADVVAVGDTALDTNTVGGQLTEIAQLLDNNTTASALNTAGRSSDARLFRALYHSGGAVTAGVGGSVNVAAATIRRNDGTLRTTTTFTNLALPGVGTTAYVYLHGDTGVAATTADVSVAMNHIPLAYVEWDGVSVINHIISMTRSFDGLNHVMPVYVNGNVGSSTSAPTTHVGFASLYAAMLHVASPVDTANRITNEIVIRSAVLDMDTIPALPTVGYGSPGFSAPGTVIIRGEGGSDSIRAKLQVHNLDGALFTVALGELVLQDLDIEFFDADIATSMLVLTSSGRVRMKNVRVCFGTINVANLVGSVIKATSWVDSDIEIVDCHLNAAVRCIHYDVAADPSAVHRLRIRDSELRLGFQGVTEEYVIDMPAADTTNGAGVYIDIENTLFSDARPLRGVRLWGGNVCLRKVTSYTALSVYGGDEPVGLSPDPRGKGTVCIDGYVFEPERSAWFPRPSAEAIKPIFLRRCWAPRLSNIDINHTNDDSLASTSDGSPNAYIILSACAGACVQNVSVAMASFCAAIAMRASNTLHFTQVFNNITLLHKSTAATPREGLRLAGRCVVSNIISTDFEDEKTVILEAGSQRCVVMGMSVQQPTATGDGVTDSGSDNVIVTGSITAF